MQSRLPKSDDLANVALAATKEHFDNGVRDRQSVFELVVNHLTFDHDCTLHNAKLLAAKSIGEVEATKTQVRLDIDSSTPYCLFINVDGDVKALSVAEIERALSCSYVRL